MKIIINIISWIFNILGVLWILLFYLTPLRYVIEFLIQGIIIALVIPSLVILRGYIMRKSKRIYYTEKDTKAIKVLTELVLVDDSEMSNKLIKWYLAKIKKIYNL